MRTQPELEMCVRAKSKVEEIKTYESLDDSLNSAYESNDAERISHLLSNDWMILESSTGLSNKEDFLAAIKSGKLVHEQMTKEVKEIKSFGGWAIVISQGRNKGTYQSEKFDANTWVTNIFVKNDDNWKCLLTQETPVGC